VVQDGTATGSDRFTIQVLENTEQSPRSGTVTVEGRDGSATVAVTQDAAPPPAPIAVLTVSPTPAFPGDTLTVTNASIGQWTESAIWIADEVGQIVAGSGTMSPTTPPTLVHPVALDLQATTGLTAWVAIASPHYPCPDPVNQPGACGDQVTGQNVVIDREPEVSIRLTPAQPALGDTVTLEAVAEGQPVTYFWQVLADGSPETPADPTAPVTEITISRPGQWTFIVTATYRHEATSGGLYQATDQRTVVVQ
jgi:hypothetical protein